MSKNIEVKFSVSDNGTLKNIASDTKKLNEQLHKVAETTEGVSNKLMNLSNFSNIAQNLSSAFDQLNSAVSKVTEAYAVQEANEARLEQVMRNTMSATDEEIQSIKDFCSAQQEMGVIGDEVQLQGAQELATYLEFSDSLKTLIPVMNDMVAQQYGLGASGESTAQIATMLGKVMEGQTTALSRYGYSFNEVQEAVLKYGTEAEKAAVLADVVGSSVGGMNQQLAQTSTGQMQQLKNTLGDMAEKAGEALAGIAPYLTTIASVGGCITAVTQVGTAFKALGGVALPLLKAMGSGVVTLGAKLLSLAKSINVVSLASKAWSAVQTALNFVLSANPIGIVIMAIAALGAAIYVAYQKSETFREVCDKVWSAIKNVAAVVWDSLCKAFETAVGWIKAAWTWLKEFLGLDGEEVEVDVVVNEPDEKNEINYDELEKKYGGFIGVNGNTNATALKQNALSLDELSEKLREHRTLLDQAEIGSAVWIREKTEVDKLSKEFHNLNVMVSAYRENASKPLAKAQAIDGLSGLQLSTVDVKQNIKLTVEADTPVVDDFNAKLQQTQDRASTLATAFSSLGSALAQSGSEWGAWALQSAASVAQTIGQIASLVVAQQAQAIGGATAAGSSLPFPANLAAIAMGVAAVIATFASMPKFAEGCLAYGPTIGLFGEYAGAANNPEVVAPLSRLRGLLAQPTATTSQPLEFRIRGRNLVATSQKELHHRHRQ